MPKRPTESKSEQDEELDEALEDTFPASDPVASEQPTVAGKAEKEWKEAVKASDKNKDHKKTH